MAGIAVPHAPSVEPYVQLPPPPEAPPTDKDVILAHEYVQQVERARYKDDDVQEADYAGATRYKATVLASTGDGQPPWLAAALAPLQEQINTIQARLTQMANRQTDVVRRVAKDSNRMAGDGRLATLEIVPFPDGTYPSEVQPPLPALNTFGAVRDLNDRDRKVYLEKYFPGEQVGGTAAEETKKLLMALGYKDSTRN